MGGSGRASGTEVNELLNKAASLGKKSVFQVDQKGLEPPSEVFVVRLIHTT
jgi:hypothetical protein